MMWNNCVMDKLKSSIALLEWPVSKINWLIQISIFIPIALRVGVSDAIRTGFGFEPLYGVFYPRFISCNIDKSCGWLTHRRTSWWNYADDDGTLWDGVFVNQTSSWISITSISWNSISLENTKKNYHASGCASWWKVIQTADTNIGWWAYILWVTLAEMVKIHFYSIHTWTFIVAH